MTKSITYPIILTLILLLSTLAHYKNVPIFHYLLITVVIVLLKYFWRKKVFSNRKFLIILFLVIIFLFRLNNFTIFEPDFLSNDRILLQNKKEYIWKFLPLGSMSQSGGEGFYIGLITGTIPNEPFFINKKIFLSKEANYVDKRMLARDHINGVFTNFDPVLNKITIENNYSKKQKSEKLYKHLGKQKKLVNVIKDYESIPFGWAMLTGSKEFISNKNKSRFMETGTMHLFAVSGLHLGFFYLLLSLALKPLRVNHLVAFFLKFCMCILYLYVIEFPISAIRALIMISFFDLYNLFNFKRKNINCFNVSVITILFVDPYVLFSLSAQLSFTVVLFILLCIPKKPFCNSIFESIKTKFISIIVIALSASAGSSLLVLDNFNFFSFISIFTNILITPIIFVFYCVNIIFFFLYFTFESCALINLHMFFYEIISFIIQSMLELSYFLPKFHNLSFEVNDFLHFLLFSFVLLLFSFSINFKFRFFLVLIYYCLMWTVCFCLAW